MFELGFCACFFYFQSNYCICDRRKVKPVTLRLVSNSLYSTLCEPVLGHKYPSLGKRGKTIRGGNVFLPPDWFGLQILEQFQTQQKQEPRRFLIEFVSLLVNSWFDCLKNWLLWSCTVFHCNLQSIYSRIYVVSLWAREWVEWTLNYQWNIRSNYVVVYCVNIYGMEERSSTGNGEGVPNGRSQWILLYEFQSTVGPKWNRSRLWSLNY